MGRWKRIGAAALATGLVLAGCQKVSRYNQKTGFCKVVQEFTTPEDCDAFGQQLDSLGQGTAAFNAPNPMQRGQTVTVTLAVADAPPLPPQTRSPGAAAPNLGPTTAPAAQPVPVQSPPAANSPGGSAEPVPQGGGVPGRPPAPQGDAPRPDEVIKALPGRTQQYTLTVGPHMTADLVGDVGFDVKPRTPREQQVHIGAPYAATLWQWDVRAKHGGDHTLTIKTAVQAVDAKGGLHELTSTPQAYTFTVNVDWVGSVLDHMEIWGDELKEGVNFLNALKAFIVALGGVLAALGLKRLWSRWRAPRPAQPANANRPEPPSRGPGADSAPPPGAPNDPDTPPVSVSASKPRRARKSGG